MLNGYDIVKTYPSFGQGISDDSFIGPENSIEDMDGIDVQSEERYAQADTAYYVTEDYTLAGGASWFKNTSNGNFISNITKVQKGGVDLALGGSAWDGMATYGTGATQQHYFFERTQGIKLANYNGSSIGSFITTGYPTANVPITAIGWHQSNILFSKGNILYFFSTVSSVTATAVTLRPGTEVLQIHTVNMNSIIVVAKNDTETIVYELEFTGGAYNQVAETTDNDFAVLGAVGNNYNVFLIGENGLWQYQGRQIQHVKTFSLTSNAKISYDKGVIIVDGTSVYKFSRKKAGRNYILTRTGFQSSVNLVSNGYILQNVSGGYKTYKKSTGYRRINTVTLRPLDGGSYQTPKHDLCYRIGFINPEWNGTPEVEKCGIKIEVQTDEMEKDISSNYVTVFEEYEDFLGYRDVTPQEVAKAIELEGYKSEFGYARTRVTIYAGSEIGTTDIYEKTPKLFDLKISANYVKR